MNLTELQILVEELSTFDQWIEREQSKNRVERPDRVQHVKDWFRARLNNDLTKLEQYTFDRALKKSEEWSDQLQQQNSSEESVKNEERVIVYDSPKWQIISPKTPEAAVKLSWGTKWCTSDHETAKEYMNDGPLYVAISKTQFKPHPKVEGMTIPIKYQFHIESNQYMNDQDHPIKPPEELRKFLFKKGALRLGTEKELNSLFQKTTHWDSYLDLRNSPITSLGNLKSVGGGLYLQNTPITSLGNLESVGGDLFLHNTPITSLDNLKSVGGYFYLYNTPITSLGNLKSIGNDFDLRYTKITSLGNLESVGGHLYLQNTKITSLGNLKSVGRGLYLYNTPITSLGNLKSVGRGLYLYNTPITSLGNLKSVGGSLYLPSKMDFSKVVVKGEVYVMGRRVR